MNRADYDLLRELASLRIIAARRCSDPKTAEDKFICRQLGKRIIELQGRNSVLITKCAHSESTRREYDEAYCDAQSRARTEFVHKG